MKKLALINGALEAPTSLTVGTESGRGVVSMSKRIALPTRVEPKVFFANERTFLSWLQFAALIGTLALGLLNFAGDQDVAARVSAAIFTLVAVAAMLYALFVFHWRARSIRKRGQAGFDDRWGPTALTVALVVAVAVNFGLRWGGAGRMRKEL